MSVSRHFTASFEHFEPCQTQLGDEIVGFVFPRVPQARHTNLSQEKSLLADSRSSGVPGIITNTESHQAESIIETISNELLQTDKTITRKRKGIDRREQCRINQVRYRKRQRLILLQLEESVKRLRKEVAYLKRVVRPELKCKHSPWAIVAEVVRQVNDYLSLWRKVDVATTTHDIKLRTFLEECFSPVVTMGDTTGVDALIEQLQHYAPNFGDPKLQLQRIESKVPGVMMATGRFQMTVTELSLCKVFLNLPLGSRIGRDGRHATLHERLLGQRLSCSCTITFLFDDNGRVDRLEVNLDLVNPLLQVFEKLEDVANTLMNCS
ncbi:Bzip transcription factor [Phytophthora megakarya]|uniref:Bzip transcription factor n=1 Tax=Phytophthora megakarya TaxID=4795 RepID=A0A225UFL1_9STRA|nr:Bzip transcription factor [Phytophthora megakarya]